MATDDRRLSDAFADLQREGQAPTVGKGTTAERVERDKTRKRPRYPSEDRRVGRRISPTLSRELVDRLREICKAEGYTGDDGQGVIASAVVEGLLRWAIRSYERGGFEWREETETIAHQRLRSKTPK